MNADPFTCTYCGDGLIVSSLEECDRGVNVDPGCINCVVADLYTCPSDGSACSVTCGVNGYQADKGEECDDGNTSNLDGCDEDCLVETGWDCSTTNTTCDPICGDGLIVSSLEECDDNNGDSGDGCFVCLIEEGWACDGLEPTSCETVCGDGILAGEEECDDGNDDNEDSCSTECTTLEYTDLVTL